MNERRRSNVGAIENKKFSTFKLPMVSGNSDDAVFFYDSHGFVNKLIFFLMCEGLVGMIKGVGGKKS